MCQFVVVSSPSVHGQTDFSRQWGILAVSGYKTHEILIIYLEISTLYSINTILLLSSSRGSTGRFIDGNT